MTSRYDEESTAVPDIPNVDRSGTGDESPATASTEVTEAAEAAAQSTNSSSSNNASSKQKKLALGPGDFFFGAALGEGAYARVVHARMKKSIGSGEVKEYAMKIMEKDHIVKENKVKYVMIEQSILSKVSHHFIIKFWFSFQDAEMLYMCMDLAPGGQLLGLLLQKLQENEERGILGVACDEVLVRFYAAEIIEALEYLHSNEIIHRDLKPENVLLTSTGHIKVADFGTSIMGFNDEASRSSFVGTAEYVSPEVLHDEPVTKACDLWALGCIIFQMFVGVTPFHAESEFLTFQTIDAHLDGTKSLEQPPAVSAVAWDLISRLLAISATERIGSGDADSGNDSKAIQSHELFAGLAWNNLHNEEAPYQPDPSKFPDPSLLKDGALDDWFLEGEATPLIQFSNRSEAGPRIEKNEIFIQRGAKDASSSSSSSHNSNSRKSQAAGGGANRGIFSSASSNKLAAMGNTGGSNLSLIKNVDPFLSANERQIFTGIVYKRKGLFSKRRQLILTDTPRLVYFDPATMELKGEIYWSSEYPINCKVINNASFDVVCSKSGRSYHLTDSEAGSRMWVDLINAMLEKQRENVSQDV